MQATTEIKSRPILFQTEMIKAILDGRKTMTRRIIKNFQITEKNLSLSGFRYDFVGKNHSVYNANLREASDEFLGIGLFCPYGSALGKDILWVRESWFPAAIKGNKVLIGYDKNDASQTLEITTDKYHFYWKQMDKGHVISPRFMPKEAARIWLEITDIKVERVQDISDEDAKAEGAEKGILMPYGISDWQLEINNHASYKKGFQYLWYTINGKESWNANDFVWVISFKVLSTTGKPVTL